MTFPVLICDDSMVARKQVLRVLKQYSDFEFYQASNGQEALDILRKQEIGLLCLDLTMPVIDGIGVLEAIKAEKIECFTVVISADIQDKMKQKVNDLGALNFLEKPVKVETLNSTLHKFGIR
ncbi:response regulator [Pseudoalteromonas denitrificans]|uniref:Response regulator receiver domain-containing protein n=1 Tax=Pseudoalteromonas denitrificans DSM 6059 TaxID=1123010 RepID=A0A1I1IU49_9GAMM|nr:response regulator [Pseudoalteromonas denitrificans]SFC37253.1 Response regulator receiver domain-containing protein [Pseudoalteromonas denitrificans DSM 6059]